MKQIIKRMAITMMALMVSWCVYTQPNITRVEYYIDGDPGYGKATALSITAGPNLVNLAININPANISSGVHILGVRALDANGGWSMDNRWLFAKPFASDTTGPGALPKITRVEYYLDSDPGYGKATALSISAGTDLSNITINLDPASLTEGVHILGVRALDAKGAWSFDNKWLFARPFASDTIPPGTVPNLKQIEYYIDTDPGYGKGIPVAQENISNIANMNISINISGLSKATHTLYVRSKDVNNAWSLDNKWDFKVGTAVTGAAIMVNSVSKKVLCAGAGFSIGYDAKGTYNAGNTFTVQLSDAAGSFATPTAIGSVTATALNGIITCTLPASTATGTGYKLRVVSSNTAVTGVTSTDALNISALPVTPTITANGSTTFCEGDSVKLTSSSATTYSWSTGATTQSIMVKTGGSYSVTVFNANGCSKTSAATTVTVNTKPVPTTTPSGNITITQGNTVTINVNGTYSSYLWSTGATASGITTGAAGSYTVTITNASGCSGTSAPVTVTVITCTKPTITANGSTTNVCPGKTVKLTSSTASSYLWSTGETTKVIAVNAAGSYTVTTGGCTSDPAVVTYTGCAGPTGLSVSSITTTSAVLSWTGLPCATKFTVQYRMVGASAWTKVTTTASSLPLTGLTAGTQYQWNITAACGSTKTAKVNGPKFKTPSALQSMEISSAQSGMLNTKLFPNPASDHTVLQISGAKGKISVVITDMAGKTLWRSDNVISEVQLPVANFSNGTYLINIVSDTETKKLKLVKEK